MKNYVLFLRANTAMSPDAFNDPKEIAHRAQWLANVQSKGIVKYLGGTLPPIPTMAGTLFADGFAKEGAFAEANHFLTGFLIIEANDLDSAKQIAATNPILIAGGSVEVREMIPR